MSNVIIPSDPNDKQIIKNALSEISNSMTRMDSERDHIKEIVNDTSERVDVPKKILRKMARIYHKQNLSEIRAEMDDVEALYEAVNP